VSAASLHHDPSQVKAPTSVPLPVPPPVYNMPRPGQPAPFTGQPAPFIGINEYPSTENRFSQPFRSTGKLKDYPQVPPPPKISQVIKFSWYSVNSCISSLLDWCYWKIDRTKNLKKIVYVISDLNIFLVGVTCRKTASVVRVVFLATDPEARVQFPALPEKKSSGSGTGSTQPREYNWGATW
jgi:hypothetical protein